MVSLLMSVSLQRADWGGVAHAKSSPGPVPLSRGDTLLDRFEVTTIKRHREFIRVRFKDGQSECVVEIGVSRDDPWSTTFYRVQPAPGSQPPRVLLLGLLKALKAWEARDGHTPFVRVHDPDADTATDTVQDGVNLLRPHASRHANPVPPPAGIPLTIGGAIALLLIWGCCAAGPTRRRDQALFGGVLATMSVALAMLEPSAIPLEWITLIHEGSVERIVASLYGHGNHGPAQDTLRWLYGPQQVAPIRVTVLLHIILTGGTALGLVIMCQRITESPAIGLLIGSAATLNPLVINAALSELPAALVSALIALWVLAYARREVAPRCAWSAMIVLSVLLAATRTELGLLSGLATTGVAAERWLRIKRPMTAKTRRLLWLLALSLITGIGGLLFWLSGRAEALQESWVFLQLPALDVLHPGILTWPIAAAATLPLGVAVLAVFGWFHIVIHQRALALGALGFVLLYRVYWASAHEGEAPYEVVRYLSLLAMPLALMAAVGWRWALRVTHRHRARWLLMGTLTVGCLVPMPNSLVKSLVTGQHVEAEGALLDMPLSRLQQIEARALLTSWEAYPECVIATVSARDPKPTHPPKAYDYVLFGEQLIEPLTAERIESPLAPWVEQHVPGVACIVFHRGIDCAVESGPSCTEEAAQGTRLSEFEVRGRPYYDHLKRLEPVRIERFQLRTAQPQDRVPFQAR